MLRDYSPWSAVCLMAGLVCLVFAVGLLSQFHDQHDPSPITFTTSTVTVRVQVDHPFAPYKTCFNRASDAFYRIDPRTDCRPGDITWP